MYLIPLLGLVGGAIIPSIWGGESGIAVIFSVIGFAGGSRFCNSVVGSAPFAVLAYDR